MDVLIGTDDGLHHLDGRQELPGRTVTHVTDGWAAVDGRPYRQGAGGWSEHRMPDGLAVACVALTDGSALAGTEGAHLVEVSSGGAQQVASFEEAPTRSEWHTPWGGPPSVRSIAIAADGRRYVNVHVGGIMRSDGDDWTPTIDLEADVHQVVATEGAVLAALGARGLAVSRDAGDTWTVHLDGLHAAYCRAVAVAGGAILISASTGPRTDRGAVYRRPLSGDEPFERCVNGLPEWFSDNVETHCLDALDDLAVIGTGSGELYVSQDLGDTWQLQASGLPPVRCVHIRRGG